MAVAAIFHLYGPVAMIEHTSLAPLRVPIDVSAARPESTGPASIERPPSSPADPRRYGQVGGWCLLFGGLREDGVEAPVEQFECGFGWPTARQDVGGEPFEQRQ